MQGISIFQQIYAPRVAHVVTGFDGVSHNTHSPYAMGGVVGSVGKMTAIVANDQADTWHIVNLKCGKIFDAVAVLGAFDESEAANMAMRYHGQYFDAVCGDVCESNTGGLQRFLNHHFYMSTNRPVYAEELAKLQDIPSTQAILWDGVQLKSHNGSSKHLLLDMMRCDDDKALLEKMDFVEEESQLDGEIAEYDALVVEAYKLESTVSKLALAMDKATSISTLKVANQTLSKPKTMRGFGVIQQLVSFELSDGQAVSIIFNVSDSEANASAKMTKDDLLVAWKYKLNSRDITAAVQPNATQNVSLNMIASRIMGLADANSEKFVAAQKKKDAMQTELANTNQRVKDLQGQEQALLQEIADLQKQLDEKAKMVATEGEKNANDYSIISQQPSSIDYSKYPVITTDDRYGEIIEVPTIWGDKVRVAKRQLENVNRTLLKRFTKAGKEVDGDSIHRENLLVGDAKLTKIAQIEKELKEKGYKVAPFPKSKQQEKKLIDEGYVGYSLDGNGWIKPSFALAVIYAIPPISQPEPVTLTGKELGDVPTPPQDRPTDYRTNLANARAVAKSLGIETKGKKLSRLLREIDIFDDNEVKKELLAEFKALASRLVLPKGYVFDLSDAEKSIGDITRWVSPIIKPKGAFDFNKIRIELRAVTSINEYEGGVYISDYVFFYTEDKNAKKDMDSLNYPNDGNINASEPKTPKATVEKMEQFLIKAVFPKIEYLKVVNSTDVDVSKLSEIGIAEITDIGNENLYFEKDGKYYVSKVGNTQNYALGEWDFAKYPDGKQVAPVTQPVQTPVVPEPTPASNKKMYTPKDILDSDLSIDEKISEAEKLLESSKLNAAKQKIKIDESNKIYWTHARNAEAGYLFTDLPRNASLASVVHAGIGLNVGFIEYLKNLKESPPKIADTQAQTTPDIGDTVIGDTTLSDLFKSDMDKKHSHSVELRVARQSILDAEDAAANAIQSNSIDAFSKYADMFPKTYNALLNWIKSSMTNPDRDYLQSIIDGALIPKESDMDTVIELAEKYENDEFITPLLEQALEVINQTQQAAVKGVV